MYKILLILLLSPILSFAQSGPGYEFSYDGAGYRIKREFVSMVSYSKPGKDNSLDTLIGAEELDNKYGVKENVIVKAYPNPAQNLLYISNLTWQENSIAIISIYDIAGKLILQKSTNSAKDEISLSSLSPGAYQVNYECAEGKFFSWKIVKL